MTEPVYNELTPAAEQLAGNTGGFRRADDMERLSKLEYIVADHHIAIQAMEREISLLGDGQQQIINNLKTIKHVLIGIGLGALIVTGSYEKVLSILLKVFTL